MEDFEIKVEIVTANQKYANKSKLVIKEVCCFKIRTFNKKRVQLIRALIKEE